MAGSNEENELITDGTETTMISSFCDVYNCTLAVLPTGNGRQTVFFPTNKNDNLKQKLLDDIGEWGTILDNYTGDGVLGAVAERRADIGVGAFYLWYLQIQSKIIL